MSYISWWKLWIPIWVLVGKIQAKPQRDASNHIGDPNISQEQSSCCYYRKVQFTQHGFVSLEEDDEKRLRWCPEPLALTKGGERESWKGSLTSHGLLLAVTVSALASGTEQVARALYPRMTRGIRARKTVLSVTPPAFLHLQFLFFTCGRTCYCGQHKECLQTKPITPLFFSGIKICPG